MATVYCVVKFISFKRFINEVTVYNSLFPHDFQVECLKEYFKLFKSDEFTYRDMIDDLNPDLLIKMFNGDMK